MPKWNFGGVFCVENETGRGWTGAAPAAYNMGAARRLSARTSERHTMSGFWKLAAGCFFVGAIVLAGVQRLGAFAVPADERQQARKMMDQGNFKDALAKLVELTLGKSDGNSKEIAEDFRRVLACHQQLNQVDQIDAYREKVAKKYAEDWIVLGAVAHSYVEIDHQGFLIAGEFRRGQHRGGGKVVHATVRDRARALQLFWQAY